MAKNLYNLTAVTTVNDSDLLHVNQGGVSSDRKVTKQNLLKEVNSSISSINSSLANNGAIDGVRVVTAGANFRYIRIKRESASTSFYGLGLAIMYGNESSCIFSIGPSTPSIKPLGNQTPTGTYSYSSGVNTAVIDLGASGQGLVILGGTLGRSSNTTIELLASL